MTSRHVGAAFAGHAARGAETHTPALAAKADRYENPLSQLVDLLIAERRARGALPAALREEETECRMPSA